MIKCKPLIVFILLLFTTLSVGSYYIFVTHKKSVPIGYSEVKDYNYVESGKLTCMALSPECGYCPGIVIDKSCYINQSKLRLVQPSYMLYHKRTLKCKATIIIQ